MSKFAFVFTLGLIISIVSAAKLPQAGERFSSTLVYFILGAVISIIGAFLWRKEERDLVLKELNDENSQKENPADLLKQIHEKITQINSGFENHSNQELINELDQLSSQQVYQFIESRHSLISRIGMSKGSEILLTSANGERYLNRCILALSDEHRAEAQRSIQISEQYYNQASNLF